jgi:peptide chain release factor 1
MLEKYKPIKEEYEKLDAELSNPANFNNQEKMAKLNKRKSQISGIVELFEKFIKINHEVEEAKEMIMAETDPELITMAEEEA